MRLIPLTLAAALLGGCALTGGDRLPICDGKHRRPANPNGSVLLPTVVDQPQVSAVDEGALTRTGPAPIASCR